MRSATPSGTPRITARPYRASTDNSAAIGAGTRSGKSPRGATRFSCAASRTCPGCLSSIRGFHDEKAHHLAAAAAVASGAAEAGFGIQAAATGKSIDFVPLVVEDYFLVCERETRDTPAARSIVSLPASSRWRDRVAQLAGDSAQGSGEIVSLRRTLPWYR